MLCSARTLRQPYLSSSGSHSQASSARLKFNLLNGIFSVRWVPNPASIRTAVSQRQAMTTREGYQWRDPKNTSIPILVSKNTLKLEGGIELLSQSPFTSCEQGRSDESHEVVLGFSADKDLSFIDVNLGKVSCTRWLACARNKLWWMTPSWGTKMSDIPTETQFLILEHGEDGPYSLLLPLIDGSFRAVLKSDRCKNLKVQSDSLILRIDSGDESITGSSWESTLLVAASWDVFEVIRRGMELASTLSGGAKPLHLKQVPESLDYFGWCTWDAFYSGVSAQGVQDGLKSLLDGGVRAKTVIIDDGWQSVEVDEVFKESITTRALRRMRMPATETMDEEFDDSEKSVLASYAGLYAGSTDLSSTMPALSDAEFSEKLRKQSKNKPKDSPPFEQTPTPSTSTLNVPLLDSQDRSGQVKSKLAGVRADLERVSEQANQKMLKAQDGLQRALPDIEDTVIQLSKEPKNMSLWSRLVQRTSGWALGFLQVTFLRYYRDVVDPAHPNSWSVHFFEYLSTGPLRWNMLQFYKASGDFTKRIISVRANSKFSDPTSTPHSKHSSVSEHAESHEMKKVTDHLRSEFGVDYIYCWHGLPSYWGGCMPDSEELLPLKPRIVYPKPSVSMLEIEPSMRWNPAVLAGIGIVDHPSELYTQMHRYLAAAGVDGVKVDCQAGLGLVGSVAGGGSALSQTFHDALEDSISVHFPGNHAINCMCHSTDNLYRMRDTAIVRASDDFYPREAASVTPHIAACAYNSLFLAELAVPDWDMFQSLHPGAHLHACARAVSGGAVYVSDKPGKHDILLLKKLVLRDGSVLRTQQPARPTRDSIFCDPLTDGVTVLKTWSHNTYSGVIGLFNLQGSSWNRTKRQFSIHDDSPPKLDATTSPNDVCSILKLVEAAPASSSGRFAAFQHGCTTVQVVGMLDKVQTTLDAQSATVVTMSPIIDTGCVAFSPIGLSDMLNSGGAVTGWTATPVNASAPSNGSTGADSSGSNGASTSQEGTMNEETATHTVEIRGEGSLIAYCTQRPNTTELDGATLPDSAITWDRGSGTLSVVVLPTYSESVVHSLTFTFHHEASS